MLLLTHIIIALISLVITSLGAVRPSHTKLTASYSLVGLTLLSGSLLIIQGAPILSTCLSGLAYTIIAVGLVVVAKRRLAPVAIDK